MNSIKTLKLNQEEILKVNPRSFKRTIKNILLGKKKGYNVIGRITSEMTDDYVYDKINDFGKTSWKKVKMYESRDDLFNKDVLVIRDFELDSGKFWEKNNKERDGIINFVFGGNTYYEFVIVKE